MSSSPDKHFFDLFMVIIGSLVGISFGIFLLARFVAGTTQEVYVLLDAPYQEQVLDNIRPVGRVALDGEDVTDTVQVATIEPVAEVLSGPQVYNQACVACHGAGIGGAPTVGQNADWGTRVAQGANVLRDHVINGYQGEAGYMPPKGGRIDLSDEEIISAMEYMLEQSR
jgi:cytochrome c5